MISPLKGRTVLFVCGYTAISGGNIMVFEHAYRLIQKGIKAAITFRYVEEGFKPDKFPHAESIEIIPYRDRTEFDFVVATYWSTVYDLQDFNAKYYLYFIQCDERLFYEDDDEQRFWVEQTYAVSSLQKVASAKLLSEQISKEFSTEAIHVPYGIDIAKFNPDGRLTDNGKVRVLIEGAGKAKFKRVNDAFSVTSRIPDIEVWYVTYDGHVEPNWKPDKVFSKVPFNEMPGIYRSCDILLKLSEVESFGLPNLEMMACGGAVITSAFSGQEEYAVNGENAFVVDIGDLEKATQRLQTLVHDTQQRKRFGESGLATARKRSWDTLKPDFAEALEQMAVKLPDGNKESCLPRLETLALGFRAFEELTAQLRYLNTWKKQIQARERSWIYRIANKLYKLRGKKADS